MSTVIRRVFNGNGRGSFVQPINSPVAFKGSTIVASITEVDANGDSFVGSARMTVHNVAPRDGQYVIWVNIEWPDPLRYRLNVLVSND
ncbi:hypothetical protein AB0I84_50565 [Streptomyces spectabilis]|uniref:Uncharacterized protein n=1 Tax=Streptomyces spectabilis TaxID=68270 RepID=A0A7W8AMN7_STRST|nr:MULTISPECIES: hypothetical protein [Streptomyces]MBB5101221.1 hypothetical protein [Streptomyces spectabilis]MCI3900422.1 hypothetical protein [Streptomyces spectabilis]GGV10094.1 hypothetical protein GCM10010245_18970 [Streptomyces spectabilis]